MRQGKNKLYKLAFVAPHDNFAAVQADDRTHDVKAKPYAVFVQAAGTVGLIKAVEYLGDFLLAKALAAVF